VDVLPQIFTGISIGSVLLVAALGLTLTFGQMGVINMAHGEFIMVGAYTAFLVQAVVPDGISLLVALPAGFLAGGLLGVLLEATVLRFMYDRPLDTLLVTFGVGLILQQVARDIFGAPAKQVRSPEWLQGQVNILGYQWPTSRLFITALAIAAVGALVALMRVTPLGRQIRATVQNRDLAETVGISTRRTDRATFFIGSGLAGVAGVALTLVGSTGPTLGTAYIISVFLVVVVGGIGQIRGTVIAAYAIGILESFLVTATNGSVAKALMFVLIIVFLQLRPQGLFAVRTRSLV
jgi:urea transport system permease protein